MSGFNGVSRGGRDVAIEATGPSLSLPKIKT
jgi:hypothetical protein